MFLTGEDASPAAQTDEAADGLQTIRRDRTGFPSGRQMKPEGVKGAVHSRNIRCSSVGCHFFHTEELLTLIILQLQKIICFISEKAEKRSVEKLLSD